MEAGNYKFKLNINSLSHLIVGSTRYKQDKTITIPRVVLLLDVSKWQGVIDFVRMKAAGIDGVIIKCGQGTAKDQYFDSNWQKAKAAGLARGSYWFWDSRVSPATQAANWWNWIKNDPGELKHYGDYEESYGGSYGGWQNFKAFMEPMQIVNPGKMGIYTGYYYWIAHSPSPLTNSGSLNWFSQFELWLAWYTTNPANVLIPKPWTELTLWQYGTMGVDGNTPNGIRYGAQSTEIDENNFNGDETEYKAHYQLTGGGKEPMPNTFSMYTAVINNTAGGNLRTEWGVSSAANTVIGSVHPNGATIKGVLSGIPDKYGVNRTWMEVIEINGQHAAGYMCENLMANIVEVPQSGGGFVFPDAVGNSVTITNAENGQTATYSGSLTKQ